MAAPTPSTIVWALEGPISERDVRWICEHVRYLVEARGAHQVICDVGAVTRPDAETVDVLARMQLTARRLGGTLILRRACGELRDLLTFGGLSDVLPCQELGLEAVGQAEKREEPGGVEEEGDPAEPIA